MPPAFKTTLTPLVVGILAAALFRQWRMVDHDALTNWLDLISKAIILDQDSGQTARFDSHHLDAAEGYGSWAEHYDGFNPLIAREQPVIETLFDAIPGGAALDVACGTGRVTALLAQRGFSVKGIDPSEAMLDRARAKVPEATFRHGTFETLAADAESVDLAVSCLAMVHTDPAVAFPALAAAVKPGGRVIVSEAHPFNAFLGARPSFLPEEGKMIVVQGREHSMSDYIAAIGAAGLTIVGCHEPAFRAEDIEAIFGRYEESYGPGFVDAVKAGLLGFPMAVIWDLRKLA